MHGDAVRGVLDDSDVYGVEVPNKPRRLTLLVLVRGIISHSCRMFVLVQRRW